ncbi:MAG: endonuclease/exonuclease/phosphatase family protein [Nostocales cyanobacterium 94392]|nr:endonuclease/exonuclease/phosphatase family protein [Nostocales cyanobacterium 94392]
MFRNITFILTFLSLSALTIVSLGSNFAWKYPIELLTHFRFQYFILSLIIAGILFVLNIRRYFKNNIFLFCALMLVAFNAMEVIPWYLPHSQQFAYDVSVLPTRLLQFNINIQNNHYQEIIDTARYESPQIALFLEIDQKAFNELNDGLKDILPNNFRSPVGGLALFTNLPLKNARAEDFNTNNYNLIATLLIDGEPVEFIGTHPSVPVKPSTFRKRNLQLAALSDYITKIKAPLIVAGDFNVTPWSPYYKRFVTKTNLHNTRLGNGILPSWIRRASYLHYPKWLVFIMEKYFSIPIDHCFVSKHFQVAIVDIGNNSNSDHSPVITDLIFKGKS